MKIESVAFSGEDIVDIIKTHLENNGLKLSKPGMWEILSFSDDLKEIIIGVDFNK